MVEIQERSAHKFTIRFLDSARALSAPTTARWRIKSLETGQIVKDWTSIASPSSEETITINSDINITRRGRESEAYELVVQSDHGDVTKKQTRAIQYKVVNISGVDD